MAGNRNPDVDAWFDRYGLDRPSFLLGFQFRVVTDRSGRTVVQVSSRDSVTEPFVTLLVACEKKPFQVVGSCDMRSPDGRDQSELCMDFDDRNVDKVRATCKAQGNAWSDAPCDRRGALGGCAGEGNVTWSYPSLGEKTPDDARKKCTGERKFIEGLPPERSSSASPARRSRGRTR